MTYVILHGELNNLRGMMNDGGIEVHFLEKDTESKSFNEKWNYVEKCLRNAEDVFELGNYYSDEEPVEGWDEEGDWNNSKRKFVSERWVELIEIIEKSLKETGRVDVELLNFFTPEKEKISAIENCKYRLRTVIENISSGTVKVENLIEIMDAVEKAGY